MVIVVCSTGLSYLLEWGLCLDAFPPEEDPAVSEAQRADDRAAQVRNQLPGFIVESAKRGKEKEQCDGVHGEENLEIVTNQQQQLLCCWIVESRHHDDGSLRDLLQEFN